MTDGIQPPSGHVFRVERAHGPVWYAKYRLPDGRQVQRKIGPAWTGRGRPAAGYVTKRLAEDWLREVLHEARRAPSLVWCEPARPSLTRPPSTCATAATSAAASRRRCATIARTSTPISSLGSATWRWRTITPASIERWRTGLNGLSPRTKNKLLVVMHGVMRRASQVWGLSSNPVAGVEKQRVSSSGDLEVFSPKRSWRSCEAPRPSRTPRSISQPRSRGCAVASCSRCAGAMSTSPAR